MCLLDWAVLVVEGWPALVALAEELAAALRPEQARLLVLARQQAVVELAMHALAIRADCNLCVVLCS